MATIVNNPAPDGGSGGGAFLIGVIVLIIFVAILLFYGLPALRQMGPIQLNVPAPQVNIPSQIDVNVTQPK